MGVFRLSDVFVSEMNQISIVNRHLCPRGLEATAAHPSSLEVNSDSLI